MVQRETKLKSDAHATHGAYTLSPTAGTATVIPIPTWVHVVQIISPSALINWRFDADPVAAGTNTQTAGGDAPASETTPILLHGGITALHLSSATPLATVRVVLRGGLPS